jgi:hypothetical protein
MPNAFGLGAGILRWVYRAVRRAAARAPKSVEPIVGSLGRWRRPIQAERRDVIRDPSTPIGT